MASQEAGSPSRQPFVQQPAPLVTERSAEGLQASNWYTKRAQQRWVVPASGMRRLRRSASSAGAELATSVEDMRLDLSASRSLLKPGMHCYLLL